MKLQISEIHLQQQIHDTSKEWLKNDYWVLYKFTLILLWCQNRYFNVLDFGWKSVVFVNLNTNFCNLADKVLKLRAVIKLVSNLMLNYSTYIYLCRVYLKKNTKIFSFWPQNLAFWYSGLFCEIHVLLLLVYLDIVILRKWRTYSKHLNGNSIYGNLWYNIK